MSHVLTLYPCCSKSKTLSMHGCRWCGDDSVWASNVQYYISIVMPGPVTRGWWWWYHGPISHTNISLHSLHTLDFSQLVPVLQLVLTQLLLGFTTSSRKLCFCLTKVGSVDFNIWRVSLLKVFIQFVFFSVSWIVKNSKVSHKVESLSIWDKYLIPLYKKHIVDSKEI